jgi:two-component system, OmpR family, response regulator
MNKFGFSHLLHDKEGIKMSFLAQFGLEDFMGKILFVEDDPLLGKGLNMTLKLEGHQSDWAINLEEAQSLINKSSYDLVLLDLNLPDGDGIDFCKKIKIKLPSLPVIILTSKSDEDSVVKGLEAGANDYVKKPYSQKELLARVKVTIKRDQIVEKHVKIGELQVIEEARKVIHQGKEIEDFKGKLFDILLYFVQNLDIVLKRDIILENLGSDLDITDRTIDSKVSQVRKILKTQNIFEISISTVYGVGYRCEKA